MNKLSIITAICRPDNVPVLQEMILPLRKLFDVRWYQMYDAERVDKIPDKVDGKWIYQERVAPGHDYGGAPQRNRALNLIKDGWVYILDDDNKLHPEFGTWVDFFIKDEPDAKAFVFNQYKKDTTEIRNRAMSAKMKFGSIDPAQIVWKREIIGDHRMIHECYWSDWYLIEDVYKDHKASFVFVDKTITYWNGLEK